MLNRISAGILAAFVLLVGVMGAQADERILKFVSDIDVARDGTLTVTETITVRAEGDQIRRGIFRDIPLAVEGANGRIYKAGFKLLSVLQDGVPAPYHTNGNSQGIRIYVGDENTFLAAGNYTYTFSYETDRQIRFFEDHDEVYWNVTGNEWIFPVDEAIARVVLPEGVKASEWTAYTGGYGETGNAFEAQSVQGGSEVVFRTTSVLPPYEGLSVNVSLPKGAVTPPSEADKLEYFVNDYRSELIGTAGLLLVLLYYFAAWWMVGRDPAEGVVFPRFSPPYRISPALAKYIDSRGFGDGGWVALSAACLNLAVKKRLRLEEDDGDTTLVLNRTGREEQIPGFGLPKGEAALEEWLNGRGSPLTLNKANGTSIQALGSKFRAAIERESRDVYFRTNKRYLIPGFILSLVTIVALLAFGGLQPGQEGFVIVFLVFSVFATIISVNLGKAIFRFASMKLRMALIFVVFGLAISGAAFGAYHVNGGVESLPVLPFIAVALVALNILFFFLISAPTALGRQALDEIEGLRMYLSVAEKERLNMAKVPDMSTGHFEELLPYAVALGVEKPWAKAFEAWLTTAAGAAAAASYHPGWYSGSHFDARHVSDSLGQTASSMAGSFRSSLPAPKSSSSGSSGSSGGFSGGGGGGGGGGGW
ncbi:putative membrane protein YgcG [Labrenzia sp. MBR-25]